MATVVAMGPALWQQNGTYPAGKDRSLLDALFTDGVLGTTSFRVTQRTNGANMSVDVTGGQAAIVTPVGSYLCTSAAATNVPLNAAPGSGTRRDLIVLTVRDVQAFGTGTNNDYVVQVIEGVASTTPVDPAIPANSTLLARVSIPTGKVSIVNSDITDRRTPCQQPALWDVAPPLGRAGQIVGTSEGALVYAGSQWQRIGTDTNNGATEKAAVLGGYDTPSNIVAGTTPEQWGGDVSATPVYSGKATVRADFSCTGWANTNAVTAGGVAVAISLNNGASWDTCIYQLGGVTSAFYPTAFSVHWIVTGTVSGLVKCHAMVRSTTTPQMKFERGTLCLRVTPA